MINISYFSLEFSSGNETKNNLAVFPFIIDSSHIDDISCVISLCGNPGLDQKRIAFLKQIHSREVLEVESNNLHHGWEADGLITRDRSVYLSVNVGDCLPVYLYDSDSRGFGLLHSGWKGTGIAANAINLMKEKWGTRPEAIAAVLGPCIRSCCYRVDEERARAFEAEFGGNELPLGPVTIKKEDGYYLDMQAANAGLLVKAGVRNIAVCENCTFTDIRLGSFRREGNDYTRMTALLGFELAH